MRPIDADYLENMGYELHRTYQQDANTMVYEVKKIADVPTIEAEPVRRGRWIAITDYIWACSKCGRRNIYAYGWDISNHELQDRYCPNCGALMVD